MHTHNLYKSILFFISIVCPGSAHLLLRQYFKSTVIIVSFSSNILLIFSMYKYQLFQQPLSLVIALVSLCVHCFFSVFDTLQQYEYKLIRQAVSLRLKLAAVVIYSWSIIVIASLYFLAVAETIVYYFPYIFLFFIVLYLATHLKSSQWKSIYVGRLSAIIYIGSFLVMGLSFQFVWDHLQAKVVILLFTILIALELSFFYLLKKLEKIRYRSLKFDVVAIITVALITTIFLFVPKYGNLPSELLRSFHNVDRFEYNYDIAQFTRKELQSLSVTPNEQIEQLTIEHRNGNVNVQAYDGNYIKIVPTRYDVTHIELQTAIEKMNQIEVIMDEEQMKVKSKLAQFEGQVSRMDFIIYIPHSLRLNVLQINVEHGSIYLNNVKQFKSINVNSKVVNFNSLFSSGDMNIKLTEGISYIFQQNGKVNVNTMSGHILLYDILREIHVETLNGNIIISNKMLNESIYGHAGVGSIQVNIPNMLLYSLLAETSFGSITINDVEYENSVSFTTPINKKQIQLYADQHIVID